MDLPIFANRGDPLEPGISEGSEKRMDFLTWLEL